MVVKIKEKTIKLTWKTYFKGFLFVVILGLIGIVLDTIVGFSIADLIFGFTIWPIALGLLWEHF